MKSMLILSVLLYTGFAMADDWDLDLTGEFNPKPTDWSHLKPTPPRASASQSTKSLISKPTVNYSNSAANRFVVNKSTNKDAGAARAEANKNQKEKRNR